MERASSGLILWFVWMTSMVAAGVLKYKGINALPFFLAADAAVGFLAGAVVVRKLRGEGYHALWNGMMDIDLGLSLAIALVALLTAITLAVRLWI